MPDLHVDCSVVKVDPDVWVWARLVPWRLHQSDTRRYVHTHTKVDGRMTHAFLHRVILGLLPGDQLRVDHANGDTLDNWRENLRIVTTAENAQNQGSRGGSSRYRGVTWDRSRGKWLAHAQLNGRKVTIGRFASEEEAGRAASAWRAEHMTYSIVEEAA